MDPAKHPRLAEAYLLGELQGEERARFELHLFECPACAEEVMAGQRFLESAKENLKRRTLEFAGPEAGALPAARAQRRRRWWPAGAGGSTLVWLQRGAALAALVLAPVVAYQQAVVIPGLRGEIAVRDQPRAVVPITLRAPTRGQGRQIALDRAQSAVLIALESPDGHGRWTAQLADGDGRLVSKSFPVEGRPGEPLYLSFPTTNIPDGSYVLMLTRVDREQSTAPAFEPRYPFNITRK